METSISYLRTEAFPQTITSIVYQKALIMLTLAMLNLVQRTFHYHFHMYLFRYGYSY